MFGLPSWDVIDDLKYRDEHAAVAALLACVPLDAGERARVRAEAIALVEGARSAGGRQRLMEGFLAQFSLDTAEGLALMGLAEALLRTPDARTQDRLIAERIASGDWVSHLGRSTSGIVNVSTRGLALSRTVLAGAEDADRDAAGIVKRLLARLGEPVIRRAVGVAVGMMGDQFVLGRTIDEAEQRAAREGVLCSFDMLGEGARTLADADRYERIYARAIETIGRGRSGQPPEEGHGISVKLSALSPRYAATQEAHVWEALYPRLKRLAAIAARHDLNLAIDAEEADRLVLSLKLIDRLAHEAELGDWAGLGVVVQAYQKRASAVIEALDALAERSGRRLMIRLVKGAYWDSEIKRAQLLGRPDYPVYTTKAATDVSFLVCAARLIAAAPRLYPQFATHNAHSLAAVRVMAERAGVAIEHQRLHGMGEALYAAALAATEAGGAPIRLRAYAPVGGHEELLPYLVRRLLENGANSSFVNALLDEDVAPDDLVRDPIDLLSAAPDRHPRIPIPAKMYGPARANPIGRDFTLVAERERAARAMRELDRAPMTAGPIIGGSDREAGGAAQLVSPVDGRPIGMVRQSTDADVDL
uniref:proline dehydrogenase family protein n=1 Tax=Sphingomonas bacterium TaxID=1895847 RepID=UPI0015774F83